MKSIIIADDNPRDRDYLKNLLVDYHITEAANGEEAMQLVSAASDSPFVITDLQMPGISGVELAKNIWQERNDARIIFWTQYSDEIYLREISRFIPPETVYGFLLKDSEPDAIQRAVLAVFDEYQCWIDQKIRPIQARLNQSDTSISNAEYEVLIDIALGLTDNAIARRRYLSRRGVQSRLRSLYSKLDLEQLPNLSEPVTETLNLRLRAVSVALRRGLLNTYELEKYEKELVDWMSHGNHA